jgi:glycosyltransferase involved in cell wall biosynthesis
VLFEPGNHHELADRIAEVLADPGAAETLRASAAQLLRRTYTWDAIAASTAMVYQRALSAPGRSDC